MCSSLATPRVAHPLIVVGLDGGDWEVINALVARGELPHLEQLIHSGLRTELRSTLPPATLPAWNAFLCSAAPGDHGVTDMFVHPQHSYALVPATANLRTMPTFLSRLARAGFSVASVGVPGTYPPDPKLGLCIAGFDAPGASRAGRRAVHPAPAWRAVQRLGGWRYAVVNEQGDTPGDGLARALIADLDVKERIIAWAYQQQPWDVFFVHLQASDTAGHHLWHTYDAASPRARGTQLADGLPSVYRRLDTLIGHLLAQASPNARVLLVSDHGMAGASDIAVHLNRVLADMGLLRFHAGATTKIRNQGGRWLRAVAGTLSPDLFARALRLAPQGLVSQVLALTRQRAVDFSASAAFSDELDYAPSIWLNERGKFPQGSLDAEQTSVVTVRIRERLLALRHPDTHGPLIGAVHTRAEIFSGAAAPAAPDLTIEPAWPGGYRPSFLASPGPGLAVRRLLSREFAAARGFGMPGVHRREGVFIARGPGLPAMEGPVLAIAEAGALVYPLLGLSAPDDLPTRLRGFWQELAASLAQSPAPCADTTGDIPAAYDTAEQAVLRRRLRDLGYIE